MSAAEPKGFQKSKRQAESMANDKQKTSNLLDKAWSKAEASRARLTEVWDDLSTLFRLVKAWVKGDYRDIPLQTIVLAVTGIIYFVNPFDLIPDYIPVFGYIDDAAVIAFVIASIREDVRRFRDWENRAKEPSKEDEQAAKIEQLQAENTDLTFRLISLASQLANTIRIGGVICLLLLVVALYQSFR